MKVDYTILVGRRRICEWLGVTWRTVKKWKQLYSFPLIQAPGIPPLVYTGLVAEWAQEMWSKEFLRQGLTQGLKLRGQKDSVNEAIER